MSDISEKEDTIESDNGEQQPKQKEIFPVNNVTVLNSKLESIKLNLEWTEKLDISVAVEEIETNDPTDPDSKAENDFNREMSFYKQALGAVTKAFKRLKKLDIPTRRPADFFAEMAKSDAHMNKVREKLLSKQTAVERREQVRSIREQKKQGKMIQREILQEKKTEKKKMLNALKKTKKGKMGAEALLNDKPGGSNKPQKGKKFREFRDNKYGYGGKKKGSKWNTAESSSMSDGGPKGKYVANKKFGRNNVRPKKHRRRR